MRMVALVVVLAAGSLTACSGTAVGTSGSSGSSGSTTSIETEGGTGSPNPPTTPMPSAYDALFGPPATTALTANSLSGVWAGTMYNTNDDVRLKVGTSSITIAVRCNSALGGAAVSTVGMEVGAVISATSIRLVESKSAQTPGAPGGSGCAITVRPQSIPKCSGPSAVECFEVSGMSLNISIPFFTKASSSYGANPDFIKISD